MHERASVDTLGFYESSFWCAAFQPLKDLLTWKVRLKQSLVHIPKVCTKPLESY